MADRVTIDDLEDLSPEELDALLDRFPAGEAPALLRDWSFLARDNQVLPEADRWEHGIFDNQHKLILAPGEGDWQTWIFLAGRGSGKTRAGAEGVRQWMREGGDRLGLIGPTASDVRDVMIEGESGILATAWEEDRDHLNNLLGRPKYEPSKHRLTWENGAIGTTYSAEEPERLRGPQHKKLWCDELAAWKYLRKTWDLASMGLRLGENPQAIVTTTPKAVAMLLEIIRDPATAITTGTTYDNRDNLPEKFFHKTVSRYEGTRFGRQELLGEILLEAAGALWGRAQIELLRVADMPELVRVVVAVDPAVSSTKDSNETGILVVGKDRAGHGYVLADSTGRLKPGEWAQRVIDAYHEFGADCIVAEGNQGGDLLKHTIHTMKGGENLPVKIVHATRGKQARAEPVSALYEQGRGHHVGTFPLLEDQLVTWEPESGDESPDRLDAMVWGYTELFFKGGKPRLIGKGVEIITG